MKPMIAGAMRVAFLALLWFSALAAAPAGAAEPFYDIHVINAQTGSLAFLGQAEKQSLQLFEKLANDTGGITGRTLRFVFHDDESSPQVAVQIANEVVALHPAVILVASTAAACHAVLPLTKTGPVTYCFPPGVQPDPGGYGYSTNTHTRDLATASLRYFRLQGIRRLAILTSTDATGQDAEKALAEVLALPENKEMQVTESLHFNISDVSVSAQIERVKGSGAQLFIAWSTGTPIATVFRGIEQAGLDIPVLTTDGNMTYAQMAQFAAFLPKALYIHSSPWVIDGDPRFKLDPAVTARQKEFYAAFRAAGIEPDMGAVLGWEPANIITAALRRLGPTASAAQLNDYLQHLKGFAGIDGIYDFEKTPQRGLDVSNALVTRWDPGIKRWQPVSQLTGIPFDK